MEEEKRILKKENGIVLCLWQNQYVTWAVAFNGGYVWGHYFGEDLFGALKDFNERVKANGGAENVN